jgi:hypothetical protein
MTAIKKKMKTHGFEWTFAKEKKCLRRKLRIPSELGMARVSYNWWDSRT